MGHPRKLLLRVLAWRLLLALFIYIAGRLSFHPALSHPICSRCMERVPERATSTSNRTWRRAGFRSDPNADLPEFGNYSLYIPRHDDWWSDAGGFD